MIVVGIAAVGFVGVGLVAAWMWAWWSVARVDLKRLTEPSVVYAAPRVLEPGLSIGAVDLAGTLQRLGYREVAGEPEVPGQFRRAAGAWQVFLRESTDPSAKRPARHVLLDIEDDRVVAVVNAADRSEAGPVALEPEVLGTMGDLTYRLRSPVPLASVPPHVIAAVLAAEDRRFFGHAGIDLWAIGRALWVNVRHGRIVEGGSTITQQLAKSVDPGVRHSWTEKLRVALLAVALEQQYSKADILETYLNTVYLGQYGPLTIYGLDAAATTFFQKPLRDLDLAEAAMLAGMIRAPNRYSPAHNPYLTRQRRNLVLRLMRDLDLVSETAFMAATQRRLGARPTPPTTPLAPYFFDHVLAQLGHTRGASGAGLGGLRIYTSLDPVLQRTAETVLPRKLEQLERRFATVHRSDLRRRLQAALIALDPATGEIRALVGGRDYWLSQFNRATQARRHPGSTFKPFVYLAALREGRDGEPPLLTAASLVEDEPITVQDGEDTWTPRNLGRFAGGEVTVRQALQYSMNVPAVRTAQNVGLKAVMQTARDAGFTSPLGLRPVLALGGLEVVPLELAAAYATLANAGTPVTPTSLRAVQHSGASETSRVSAPRELSIKPEEAYLVTHLLQGVMERGTGGMARVLGVEGAVAGKTGSTDRDAWLVGYTPRLVTLVWIGFDGDDKLKLTGARGALPIWSEFMRTAMNVVPSGPFPVPPGVVLRDVDATNGKLATPYCRFVITEAFLPSAVPRQTCTEHHPTLSQAGPPGMPP